jgi:heme/copper-type cytochrome/quinol oxidase subunit 2
MTNHQSSSSHDNHKHRYRRHKNHKHHDYDDMWWSYASKLCIPRFNSIALILPILILIQTAILWFLVFRHKDNEYSINADNSNGGNCLGVRHLSIFWYTSAVCIIISFVIYAIIFCCNVNQDIKDRKNGKGGVLFIE